MTDHCPTCGACMKKPRPEYPDAERLEIPFAEYPAAKPLGIQYCGRDLYEIVGLVGIWFSCVIRADLLGEECVAAKSMYVWTFCRATAVEERVKRAMQVMEEPK